MSKYRKGENIKIMDGSGDAGVIVDVDEEDPKIGTFYKIERHYTNGKKLTHWYDEIDVDAA